MDCAQFELIVQDLDRPRTEGSAMRESALAHAKSCERCARLLAEAESLNFALRALATEAVMQQAPPQVEAALVDAFRREQGPQKSRVGRWQIAAIGIAAAVLLALGLTVYQRSRNAPLAANHQNLPSQLSQSNQAAGQTDQAGAEDADSFFVLPYSADPAAIEDGAILRVQLTPAALASLGVSVSDAGNDEPVLADLVVSEDGTPQAIRLVQDQNVTQNF